MILSECHESRAEIVSMQTNRSTLAIVFRHRSYLSSSILMVNRVCSVIWHFTLFAIPCKGIWALYIYNFIISVAYKVAFIQFSTIRDNTRKLQQLSQLAFGRTNNACGELVKVLQNFLKAMKLVPPKDLGSICSSWSYSLQTLIITTLFVETTNIIQPSTHYFLEGMVNEHVIMNLVSLNKNLRPHKLWDLTK